MTTEIENERPALAPEQATEAEKFKEQANEYFKSEEIEINRFFNLFLITFFRSKNLWSRHR